MPLSGGTQQVVDGGGGGFEWQIDSSGRGMVYVGGSATLPVKQVRPGTSAVTTVAASVTAVTLLPANANRLDCSIFNTSTAVLYVKLGPAVTTALYTVPVAASGLYEVLYGWAGIITGIWGAANGAALVTELTP
jgi:hypothetical protein